MINPLKNGTPPIKTTMGFINPGSTFIRKLVLLSQPVNLVGDSGPDSFGGISLPGLGRRPDGPRAFGGLLPASGT